MFFHKIHYLVRNFTFGDEKNLLLLFITYGFDFCPFRLKCSLSPSSRLPFNWKTPFGYVIAMIIFAEVTFYILCCGVIGVCLLFGSCWLIQSIVQDIAHDMNALDVPKKKWQQNRMEMRIMFNNLIDDFSHAKELSGKRANTLSCSVSKNNFYILTVLHLDSLRLSMKFLPSFSPPYSFGRCFSSVVLY